MKRRLVGNSACKHDNDVYFTVFGLNIIGHLDLNTLELSFIFGPEEELFSQFMLWGDIEFWNEMLFVAPYMAEDVWMYDFEKRAWKKLLTSAELKVESSEKFTGIQIYDNQLFAIGHKYPNVICYDLLTSLNKVTDIINKNDKETHSRIRFFAQSIVRRDNILYIVNESTSYIIRIDMKSKQYKWIQIGSDNRKNRGITYDGKDFWIIPSSSNDTLIRWNESDGIIKEYAFSCKISNIWGGAILRDEFYLYGPSEKAVILEIKQGVFRQYEYDVRYIYKADEILLMWDKNGKLFIDDGIDKKELIIDIDDRVLNEYIEHHGEQIREGFSGSIVDESRSFGLTNWISAL